MSPIDKLSGANGKPALQFLEDLERITKAASELLLPRDLDKVEPSYARTLQDPSALTPQGAPPPPPPGGATGVSLTVYKPPRPTYSMVDSVGPGCANNPADVAWVRGRLNLLMNPDTKRPYLDVFDPANQSCDAALTAALAAFQARYATVKDGRVDPRGSTAQALARSPAYHLDGSVGVGGKNDPLDVARVQQTLVQHGYLVPGHFTLGNIDPKQKSDPTMVAIALFQQNFTRSTDTLIDVAGETHRQLKHSTPQATLKSLNLSAAVGNVSVVQKAQSAADILAVQLRLVHHGALGFDDFKPGEMNNATKSAITAFQARFMKKPDGRVDRSGRTNKLLALDRTEMDARYPKKGASPEPAVDGRGNLVDDAAEADVVDDAALKEDVAPPISMVPTKTGFHLEAFPITGTKFNIGYDKDWKNFDHPTNNSDYYLGAGPHHAGGHHGVDIFGVKGTPLVAPVSGRIVKIVKNDVGAGGRCIVIQRGKELFYMCHMDSVAKNLKAGDSIFAGAPVGTLGNSGNAKGTAPHLHFSTYTGKYSNSTDPFPFLIEALKAR